jgi:hypothetical protein
MSSTLPSHDWKVAHVVTIVTFLLLATCCLFQLMPRVPDVIFSLTSIALLGYVISSIFLFSISLIRWRSLSKRQLFEGLSVFPLTLAFFLLVPLLH